jgi:hypothetical protein
LEQRTYSFGNGIIEKEQNLYNNLIYLEQKINCLKQIIYEIGSTKIVASKNYGIEWNKLR